MLLSRLASRLSARTVALSAAATAAASATAASMAAAPVPPTVLPGDLLVKEHVLKVPLDHSVPGGNYIDGAFFGSTFPHLFLQTYGELRPARCTRQYVPRVFGFKVHQGAGAAGSSSGGGGSIEAQACEEQQLEEWPKRPKGEPVSDWDS